MSRDTTPAAGDDLARFRFHNAGRPDLGRRGIGNLTVCGHYGERERFRPLDCLTPAKAAGLAGHVWPVREWVTFPTR